MSSTITFAHARRDAPASLPPGLRRVVVILLKPTQYDDDGFPRRFRRGVIPSDSLAVLHTLTAEALANLVPSSVTVEVHLLEDGIVRHAQELDRLARRFPEPGTALIVGLVAVQTAQFPRACDLIARWQQRGATCVIGGFHVSGSIATMFDGVSDRQRSLPCPHVMPAEIQELMDQGVVVFHGEAEDVWQHCLRDILEGHPVPLYRGGQPYLGDAPLPAYQPGYFEDSFATRIKTVDTGRGCPFVCSFCTIINVQGRTARFRDPQAVLDYVLVICQEEGKAFFFFTDDNFARNPQWETLLDGLIELRAAGHDIRFMVEADLACHKIPNFIEKLGQAGCSTIFMGVESVNPDNLESANKRQNNIEQYERLFARCHASGMLVHAGYIVGFPHDTPESVAADVEELKRLGVDQVSFFTLMPLPGSEDHAQAVARGVAMDSDFSRYDSTHAVVDHPLMSREEWVATYQRAWRQFYTIDNMLAALARCPTRDMRHALIRNLAWYRWSFGTERAHPMVAGFYCVRPYGDRRPGAPHLPWWRYAGQEVWRHLRYLGLFLKEFYVLQHLVYDSEFLPSFEKAHDGCRDHIRGFGDWCRLTFGRRISRRWLNAFWRQYASNRWHLLWNPLAYRWHVLMLPFAISEAVYTIRFVTLFPRLLIATTS